MLIPTRADYENLRNILLVRRDSYTHPKAYGICKRIDEDQRLICERIWVNWEHYSGNPVFPVPSGNMPHIAYFKYKRWSKKSKYGQMRYKLLDYLIEQLEFKIKELS